MNVLDKGNNKDSDPQGRTVLGVLEEQEGSQNWWKLIRERVTVNSER